jgi:hypothetical protein
MDIIARNDGLFEFRVFAEIAGPDDNLPPGKAEMLWVPEYQSGLYAAAEAAEFDAMATFDWLAGRISN